MQPARKGIHREKKLITNSHTLLRAIRVQCPLSYASDSMLQDSNYRALLSENMRSMERKILDNTETDAILDQLKL